MYSIWQIFQKQLGRERADVIAGHKISRVLSGIELQFCIINGHGNISAGFPATVSHSAPLYFSGITSKNKLLLQTFVLGSV